MSDWSRDVFVFGVIHLLGWCFPFDGSASRPPPPKFDWWVWSTSFSANATLTLIMTDLITVYNNGVGNFVVQFFLSCSRIFIVGIENVACSSKIYSFRGWVSKHDLYAITCCVSKRRDFFVKLGADIRADWCGKLVLNWNIKSREW